MSAIMGDEGMDTKPRIQGKEVYGFSGRRHGERGKKKVSA